MKIRRVLAAVLAGAGFAVGVLLWCIFGPLPDASDAPLQARDNAVWMRHQWFASPATLADLQDLAHRLAAHRVDELYVHVGPLDARGRIPETSPVSWPATLSRLRRELPGVRVMAWLGGVTTWSFGAAEDTVDLSSPAVRGAIVDTVGALMKSGFDGVQYDLEVVPSGDSGFLALLDETRRALSDGQRLGVAAPNLRPALMPIPHLWSAGYYTAVAQRCDEIAVMSYDTGLFTPQSYARFVGWETAALCRLLPDSHLLFGVPTYKDASATHHPSAETLRAALRGVALGLGSRATPFRGISVYAEWTTTPDEWDALPQ